MRDGAAMVDVLGRLRCGSERVAILVHVGLLHRHREIGLDHHAARGVMIQTDLAVAMQEADVHEYGHALASAPQSPEHINHGGAVAHAAASGQACLFSFDFGC